MGFVLLNSTMFIILILIISLGLFPGHVLEVTQSETGQRIFGRQIRPGDRFSLSYKHSVQLSTVVESFEVDKDYNIVLTDMTFSDHGAGLPYNAYNGVFSVEDGKFIISDMNVPLPGINLGVGRDWDNVFIMGDRRMNLSEKFGDSLMLIRMKTCCFGN